MKVMDINNLKSRDYTPVQFIAPELGNFDLKPSSPAINKGTWMEFPVILDVINRSRPFANLNDIGAYECHDSSLLDIREYEKTDIILKEISPNPFRNVLNISYTLKNKSVVNISICDSQGSILLAPIQIIQEPGQYIKTIENINLPAGLYFFRMVTNHDIIIKKIISMK